MSITFIIAGILDCYTKEKLPSKMFYVKPRSFAYSIFGDTERNFSRVQIFAHNKIMSSKLGATKMTSERPYFP